MAEFAFSKRFLQELAEFEKSVSSNDLRHLEQVLASIVQDPYLPGRITSFYEPTLPSYLYRSGNLLIHYRVTEDGGVEFLNVFWPKV